MHFIMLKTGVENVHLPLEKHDYGPSKRAAAYNFLGHYLKLNRGALPYDNGYQEDFVKVLEPEQLKVFDAEHPFPAGCPSGRSGSNGIPGIPLKFSRTIHK